jgi:hypothetical protein
MLVETSRCFFCGSVDLDNLKAEIALRRHGLQNLDQIPIFLFPEILICLSCGTATFTTLKDELRAIGERKATTRG